jgi:hypothetical protein
MSNSTTSAASTSYKFTITTATAGAKSIVIDFCEDTSIIGASCSTTGGVNASSATLSVAPTLGTWSVGSAATSTVKLTNSGTALLGSTSYTFTLAGITNPTTTASFYVRMYTYACQDYGLTCTGTTAYSSPTVVGSDLDYGGFALSTAANVQVSATVMETLTFCVSDAAPGNGCTSTSAPTVVLGAGSPLVLGTTLATASTFTQLSTNALTGAIVRLWVASSGSCAGLSRDGGSTCPIANAASSGSATIGTGSGLFGLQVANGTGGTGSVTATSPYNVTGTTFAMQNATLTAYGDPIESSTAACANVNSQLTYGAAATTTTPAGVYTTNEALIATGTF